MTTTRPESRTSDGPLLLVVEDDRSVREMLSAIFQHEGYRVEVHPDAESASDAAATPDLAILDVGLPGRSGLDLCADLRDRGYGGPVLLLTARHEVSDRVAGLDAGADDYLVKPFALDELLARVRAMLRRAVRSVAATANLRLGDLVLDLDTRTVERAGTPIALTKKEFDLLHLLLANSPSVLPRDLIHDRLWGFDGEHLSNALEVLVSQLRKKTEGGGGRRLIHTVRGVGYVARQR